VVEGKANLVRGHSDSLLTSSLELLNEILVTRLGETTALIGIKVDVINPERALKERLTTNGIIKTTILSGRDPEELNGAELNVDLDLMVLEGN